MLAVTPSPSLGSERLAELSIRVSANRRDLTKLESAGEELIAVTDSVFKGQSGNLHRQLSVYLGIICIVGNKEHCVDANQNSSCNYMEQTLDRLTGTRDIYEDRHADC